MNEQDELEMEELLGRVTALTKELLEEGGEPHAVVCYEGTTQLTEANTPPRSTGRPAVMVRRKPYGRKT